MALQCPAVSFCCLDHITNDAGGEFTWGEPFGEICTFRNVCLFVLFKLVALGMSEHCWDVCKSSVWLAAIQA